MQEIPKGFVSYIAHEADMARAERVNARLAIALAISLAVNAAAVLVITKKSN